MSNSDINRPNEVVSDDAHAYLSPELVTKYDFDTELDDEEVYEIDFREQSIVSNYSNYIDMTQINNDNAAPEISTFKPPQVIRVISKVARTLPSGVVVLDYQIEVEESIGASKYEMRVLQQ